MNKLPGSFIEFLSCYFSGRGSGSFAGGFLIGSFGIRQTFRLMGLMSVICGAVYGLLYFFWLHKYDLTSKDYSEDSTGICVFIYIFA